MFVSTSRSKVVTGILAVFLTSGVAATETAAAVPPPPNDTAANAEVVTGIPAVHYGRNVNAADDISATTLPGLNAVPGPDVFYSFTPSATGSYWVMMVPWVQVPVYASSGGTVPVPNLCVYIREVGGSFVAGSDANFRGAPDTVIATLSAGTTYEIVVDSTETVDRAQQFEFTLVVATAQSAPEDCFSPGSIPSTLPAAVVGTLTGATDDVSFTEGTGRCDMAYSVFTNGVDHVYEFTTGPDPNFAGDYVIDLIPAGSSWDGYVYVVDSCPPFYPLGCLGAANHGPAGMRQDETLVVTLDYDTTYYVVVDAASFFVNDAKYALIVDRAAGYDITEVEGNDSAVGASDLLAGANGGQIVGPDDVDYWAVPALSGEKVYAFLDHGNAMLSGLDSELRFLNTNGTSLIEFDDNDGEGSDSPVATYTWRTSAFAATIAGVPIFSDGTYYLQARSVGSATLARYRLHYGIQPAGRAPAPECEPNGERDLADASAKAYFAGTIATVGDIDTYLFDAVAGEWVYIALDGDPERNSGGSDPDSPLALDGALLVYDPDGDILIADHDDLNDIEEDQVPDYPAEGLAFIAPTTGTYAVRVSGSAASGYGLGRTYELAIFRDSAAPTLVEDSDPVIDSIVPDVQTDSVAVTASDDAAGDSGICSVTLAPGSVNLQLTGLSLTPGDPNVAFSIALIDSGLSGDGKLVITDCAGNTACAAIEIDASAPICSGQNETSRYRTYHYDGDPIHVPDNKPTGGIFSVIDVPLSGNVVDVNVTMTIESTRVPDVAAYLVSPQNTAVELIYQAGSVTAYDITDATFDDDANEPLSFFGDEPYTGRWLPSDPNGLTQLIGEAATGTWKLNVIDTSNYSSGGCRLMDWSLEIDANAPGPEYFVGAASDIGGIATVELQDPNNVELIVDPGFASGDLTVDYEVRLVNPSQGGSGRVVITDVSDNTCESLVGLAGLPDSTAPTVEYDISRNLVFGAEVQQELPPASPAGVVSTVTVPDDLVVAKTIVDLTISTRDVGRNAATLSHAGQFASLINRVGMDERGSVGLTKDNIEITLDDDAPVADDAHLEPALGSIEFLGLHQPDGRGEFIGDGIDSDKRDNMLFALEGLSTAGDWELYAGDFRLQGSSGIRTILRRWEATVVSPGAPERLTGIARDRYPEAGICNVALAGGASNLSLTAAFAPGDDVVQFTVELTDPAQAGSGTLEITDCAGNVESIPVSLAPELADQTPPMITGSLDPNTHVFSGTATDSAPGDSGVADLSLAPYADNLDLQSLEERSARGTPSVDFEVSLLDPNQNGRGYVRVTDDTGYRRHILIEIDATPPACSGSIGHTKRYQANVDTPLPDGSAVGVTSSILVPDPDRIEDLNVTLNITHTYADDIDASFVSPTFLTLFSDIGLTGNNFTDTTLDDEAAQEIPDSSSAAPYTGSYRPEAPATLSVFDGGPAAGSYALKIVDDAFYNVGSFDSWSLTITSSTFPERYDGRAEDSEPLGFGLCSIELLPGATNLAITVDPFDPGDQIVRYSVELVNPALDGQGVVEVADCGGNTCTVPICLTADIPPARLGDLDGNGTLDTTDFASTTACLGGPDVLQAPECDPCRLADFDFDADVDLIDLAGFQTEFATP